MISRLLTVSLYLSLVLGLVGCTKPEQVDKEPLPRPLEAGNPSAAEPRPRPGLPQPAADEVRLAIERSFQSAVSVEASGKKVFFTGDFNGDGSQDIAVLVKPAKDKLAYINSPVANWTIADPLVLATRSEEMEAAKEAETEPGSPSSAITERDGSLLAVIHGYGPRGWRDPEARQAYLLKNAAGVRVRTATQNEVAEDGKNGGALPHLYGDVIQEKLGGKSGFIYYDGAGYLWFTPGLYKRPPASNAFH